MKWIGIALLLVLLAVKSFAQSTLDARTKSILDLYYLSKSAGAVTTTNILDGTIRTNDLSAALLTLILGYDGFWENSGGTIQLKTNWSTKVDVMWTTNATGEIVVRP